MYYLIITGVLWQICFVSTLIPPSYINVQIDNAFSKSITNQTFDFIVIGSGPTGSVIANRLSEVPEWNVLLIEAGTIPSAISDIPAICGHFQFTGYDWGYRTERQNGFCKGCIRNSLKYGHGKVLGGTSIINFMIHVRGNRRDYDRWAKMGNPGWSYQEVLPYFLKSEDAHIERADAGYHKKGGYLTISDVPFRTKMIDALVQSAQECGHPYVDYNGKEQLGVSYVQTHTRNGRRCSAEKAFLRPVAHRSNLKILTNSKVVKILIDPTTKSAYGVQYARKKKYYNAFASKEVIVSAGGLNSPQLLMLSGIGPKEHLQEFDIPVIANLPVGKKMYDHPSFMGMGFEIDEEIVLRQDEVLTNVTEILTFLKLGNGTMTSIGGVEGLIYMKSKISTDPDPLYPDMELILLGGNLASDNGHLLRRMFNIPRDIYEKVWKIYESKPMYQIMPMLVHPKSVGYVKLASKNPFHFPKFYANFFSDPENKDIKTFIAALREVQRMSQSPTMKKLGTRLIQTPIPGCETMPFDSDEYWECALRSLTSSLWHQVATCKMGPKSDPEAVVDNTGKVHGLKHLRVADTSIIPMPLTAHTAGPSYMVGERISDFIKEEWRTNKYFK
ncbi:glucose dehydrogenase [FAD, quinone]-like [Diabrotica virgifera virgifera]|uniref:Glucose dehydrogenase [FAD, quinone]-like n=1 Tax=Diabrotica virgifera virgifera TaxID=50390 RepID=A0ABM5L4G1_DIAVI|nr:glucose dehydrogenase [FAD, quinone]-like [Diabrotica virgifera virgifera]